MKGLRRDLGQKLKVIRVAAGWSQQLARKIDYTRESRFSCQNEVSGEMLILSFLRRWWARFFVNRAAVSIRLGSDPQDGNRN